MSDVVWLVYIWESSRGLSITSQHRGLPSHWSLITPSLKVFVSKETMFSDLTWEYHLNANIFLY